MKIGYDGSRFFHNASGLGNYSRDLVRVLSDYFPENEYLIFAHQPTDRGKELLDRANVKSRKLSLIPLSRQMGMGLDAQRENCDIFHGLSGELPLIWGPKSIKKIVTIHDLIFLKYPEFYFSLDVKTYTWKYKKAAEKADLVIAISEQTKKDVIQYFGIPESKIKVIYQTCHHSFKEEFLPEDLENTQKKFNLPDEFLLSVGTIQERKNLLSVVQAIENEFIPLVVVGGEKKYAHKVYDYIREKGMENRIYFLKDVDMSELAKIYRLAKIFIYPSLYEGFGIPVIEALFSKTPVITSNLSSLPEAGGPYSTYVNPMDVADIRSKILNLWENPAKRIEQTEQSFEFVQRFNEENIANDLMTAYRKVLSNA